MLGFRYAPPRGLCIPVVLVAFALSGCAALNPFQDVEPGPDTAWRAPARTTATARPAPRPASGPSAEPARSVPINRPGPPTRSPEPALRRATSSNNGAAMLAQLEEQLRDAGEDWIGVPYRYGGTTRRGIDCSAFVQTFMHDHAGLDLTRTTATQVHEGVSIDKDELRPGDLVFFRRRGTRHVGVYLDDGEFIHASSSRGVTVSNLEEGYYQRHYWTARRVLDRPALLLATNPRSRRPSDGEAEAEAIGAETSEPDGSTRSAW